MATTTTVVVGRIGDAYDSDTKVVTNEVFTSVFDTPVKLLNHSIVGASTNVEPLGGGVPFVEGALNDYVMDDEDGTITVLSTGAMADATQYEVDYSWIDDNLAYKVNALTSPKQVAGKFFYVSIARMGRLGIAVVVTEN
jgi:hypothetical protein